MTKKIYFENLDGLRFLCFLSVFFYHSFYTEYTYISSAPLYQLVKRDIFGNGNLGVNFFFVLSGFLITYLLIEEKKMQHRINLRFFWTRRILRIWPLYYFCVAFGFVIFPMLKVKFGGTPNETASPAFYLSFLSNFDFIQKGLPDASILGVLWSVAIEEQFYVVWPILLAVLPLKRYWIAFVSVIGISLLFRAQNPTYMAYEHHTLSCIGDMAVGAFGAWGIIEFPRFRQFYEQCPKWLIAVVYALFAGIFFFRDEIQAWGIPLINVSERILIAGLILFIICEQNYAEHSLFKMSRFPLFTRLGRISYGLYCLHFIGILVTTTLNRKLGFNKELWQVMLIETPVALLLSIGLSTLSYSFLEKPFLRLKRRFEFITK